MFLVLDVVELQTGEQLSGRRGLELEKLCRLSLEVRYISQESVERKQTCKSVR